MFRRVLFRSVINVVVVGVDVVVEVVIDIDGGGFDECGYGSICD